MTLLQKSIETLNSLIGFDSVSTNSNEQIVDAFQRRVKPETMTTIIVGGDG